MLGNAVIHAKNTTLNAGDEFELMKGVTARDDGGNGQDLTKNVTISGKINTYIPGKYKITYKVTGANGVTVSKEVTVTVKEPTSKACF